MLGTCKSLNVSEGDVNLLPAITALFVGGASSTRYRDAVTSAIDEKKLKRKRPPMKRLTERASDGRHNATGVHRLTVWCQCRDDSS